MRKFLNRFIIFFSLLIFISSCSRPKDILSMHEMTEVLVDMHKVDGIFEMESFRYFNEQEKAKYYQGVLAKHEITQAQFDSSVVWYSHDPKKFEKIYNRVIIQLEKYEDDIKKEVSAMLSIDTLPTYAEENLWLNDSLIIIDKDKDGNPVRFIYKDTCLSYADEYILSFVLAKSVICDTAYSIELKIHYANTYPVISYRKIYPDTVLTKYTLNLKADRLERIDSLSGTFFNPELCEKGHYRIEDISLIRQYNPSIQDSIRIRLEQKNNIRNQAYYFIPLPFSH